MYILLTETQKFVQEFTQNPTRAEIEDALEDYGAEEDDRFTLAKFCADITVTKVTKFNITYEEDPS